MSDKTKLPTNRLYNDLAWIWPLWGGVEDYRAECESAVELILKHSQIEPKTILDIGCGGGKCSYHLKRRFKLTGIDISEPMLAHARELNPDCEFLKADMRTLDLGRTFDAVYVNSSIAYMQTRAELRAAFESGRRHLEPGGLMFVRAVNTKETFVQNKTYLSTASEKNLELTMIQNYYDPDTADETYEGTMVFLIRENGKLKIEHDRHVVGLFPRQVWRETFAGLGFELFEHEWPNPDDEGPPLTIFICRRPL